LSGRYHEYEKTVPAIQESLYRANLDDYALYLIHWPNPIQDVYVEAMLALMEAQNWGMVRSIGVCNCWTERIDRLAKEIRDKPRINQIELHPFFNQEAQRKWHAENNVQTQSWSPLARANQIFEKETIQTIAATHEKSASQVILRWHYQLGSIAIPKSASKERQ